MLLLAGLFIAGAFVVFIRGEYWLGAGISALAIGCIVLFIVLRKRRKKKKDVEDTLHSRESIQEKTNIGGTDITRTSLFENTINQVKVPKPNPACPICHGHGLKTGNFTGDLVNCDCMEEND